MEAEDTQFLSNYIRKTDLNTFLSFICYYGIGAATLFYWEGTWTSLNFLNKWFPFLELHVFIFVVSLLFHFVLALLCPTIQKHLRPHKKDNKLAPANACDRPLEIKSITMQNHTVENGSEAKQEVQVASSFNVPELTYKTKLKFRNLISQGLSKLGDVMQPRTLQLKVLLYCYHLSLVGSWFGPWSLIDYYYVRRFQPYIVYSILQCMSVALLTACGKLQLVVVSPFHFVYGKDDSVDFITLFLWVPDLPKSKFAHLLHSLIKVVCLENLVFVFWYSAWGLITLIVSHILDSGLSSLPIIVLPIIGLMVFIPNFFVLSHVEQKLENSALQTILAYVQGLCNTTFWICFWSFSAGLTPQQPGWEVARPLLFHGFSFLVCATLGTVINLGT